MYTAQQLEALEIIPWTLRVFEHKVAEIQYLKQFSQPKKILVLSSEHHLSEKEQLFIEDLKRCIEFRPIAIILIRGDLRTGLKQIILEGECLIAPNLETLMQTPLEKIKLWEALK